MLDSRWAYTTSYRTHHQPRLKDQHEVSFACVTTSFVASTVHHITHIIQGWQTLSRFAISDLLKSNVLILVAVSSRKDRILLRLALPSAPSITVVTPKSCFTRLQVRYFGALQRLVRNTSSSSIRQYLTFCRFHQVASTSSSLEPQFADFSPHLKCSERYSLPGKRLWLTNAIVLHR